MGNRTVDEDGNVYEQGWDGQYRQKQGVFGPQQERDFFGNPKVDRDFFGNPKAERGWFGQQKTSSRGLPLFQLSGAGSDWGPWGGLIILVLLLAAGIFIIAGWIGLTVIRLCIRYPKVMLPIVGVCIAIAAVSAITARPVTPAADYTASTQQQVAVQDTPPAVQPTPTEQPPTILQSTAPPLTGPILYKANWTKGLQGWSGAGWSTLHGMLVNGDGSDVRLVTAPYQPGLHGVADYAVEAQVRRISGPLFSFYMRRAADHGYSMAVSAGEGKIAIWADPATAGLVYQPYAFDHRWHTYRVEVRGIHLTVVIDGRIVAETTSARYRDGGWLGLYSWKTPLAVRSFRVVALGRPHIVQVLPVHFVRRYVNAVEHGYPGANLRAHAVMGSAIKLLIPDGSRVSAAAKPVIGADGRRWSKVRYRGMTGYVLSVLLGQQKPQQAEALYVDAAGDGFVGVNVRVQPRMAARVTTGIGNGARVYRVSTLKDEQGVAWDKVLYHGETGYVRARFLNHHKPPASITQYVDAAGQGFVGANLRTQANLQATIETLIPNGAPVRVFSVIGGADNLNWSKVTYKGTIGYVHSYVLGPQRPRASMTMYVDGVAAGFTGVNLRPHPSAGAPIRRLIPNGARLAVMGVVVGDDNQNWSHIIYDGVAGYAHSAFLGQRRPPAFVSLYVEAAAQGYVGANLRMRPSMNAPIEVLIPNGARVQAMQVVVGDDTKNWSKVSYKGMTGYAHSAVLSR